MQNLVICETNHAHSHHSELPAPIAILLTAPQMTHAVNFHSQHGIRAVKVHNEAFDGLLSSEFEAVEPPASQLAP